MTACRGARIGVPDGKFWEQVSEDEKRLFAAAVAVMQELGAEVIDPVAIAGSAEGYWQSNVLVYEFKAALNAYLATLGPGAPVRSLSEIIAFNNRNPEATLRYGQTLLADADRTSGNLTEPEYLLDRLKDIRRSRQEGIDASLAAHKLDALLFPGSWGCWLPARAGYPSIIVPAGYTTEGKPMGVTFTGRAWSEPTLIRLGYAFEQATKHRVPPVL